MKGLKLWEVLKALDEEKEVQYYDYIGEEWCEPLVSSLYNFSISIECGFIYRIKPEEDINLHDRE